jgi:hypothetical protein
MAALSAEERRLKAREAYARDGISAAADAEGAWRP